MNLNLPRWFQMYPSLNEVVSITQIGLRLLEFTQMFLILSKFQWKTCILPKLDWSSLKLPKLNEFGPNLNGAIDICPKFI